MNFCAKAVLLKREEDGTWKESTVEIKSVAELRAVFNPFDADVTQVDISKYQKVYYCTGFMRSEGIDAIMLDKERERHFMSSPLLLVECDDEKPIDISDSCVETIKETIDFY